MKFVSKDRVKHCAIAAILCVTPCAFAEVLPGIKGLQNNTVANAEDLNQNFEVLSEQTLTNEERIGRLEGTSVRLFKDLENPAITPSPQTRSSSRMLLNEGAIEPPYSTSSTDSLLNDGVVELLGGRLELDVNCGTDPWALVDAYQTYGRYKELILTLSGICYGAFYWNREGTGGFREPFQALTLRASEGEIASIIPRPNGTSIAVYTKDGSFLKLENLELYLGPWDVYGVYVWNNSNATLQSVRIVEADGDPGPITRLAGLHVDNNSSVTITGGVNTVSVSNSYSAVMLDANSMLRGYGGLKAWLSNCSAECHALDIRHSTIVTDNSGPDYAWDLRVPTETQHGHSLYAVNSTLDFNQNGNPIFSMGWFVSRNSYLSVHGGIKLGEEDDFISFSGRAEIAHYDNRELPADAIRCSGPNTLTLYGLSDYTDPDSYQYLEHDTHSGPGGVLEGLADDCMSSQEWTIHFNNLP